MQDFTRHAALRYLIRIYGGLWIETDESAKWNVVREFPQSAHNYSDLIIVYQVTDDSTSTWGNT